MRNGDGVQVTSGLQYVHRYFSKMVFWLVKVVFMPLPMFILSEEVVDAGEGLPCQLVGVVPSRCMVSLIPNEAVRDEVLRYPTLWGARAIHVPS
jgi:hypothetical protein